MNLQNPPDIFYDKTNENIVGQIFCEDNKMVKNVKSVNNTFKTTFISSANTNFKKITISCPPISSIPADTHVINTSSTSKSNSCHTSSSDNSSGDSYKCVLDSQRIHRSRTVKKNPGRRNNIIKIGYFRTVLKSLPPKVRLLRPWRTWALL